jgi:RNA polymerase sporulation-specific sigma factor
MVIETFMAFLQKVMFFSSYINNTSSFPRPLTKEEEKDYLDKALNGDLGARDKLIHHNLRLVVHVVKKYNQSEEADDLISVGSLGLIKAINSYRVGHNTQFSTYAARCIENEILMLIRSNKKHKNNLNVEDVLGKDDDGNEITIGDLSYDDDVDLSSIVEERSNAEKLNALLKKVLNKRELEIMSMRYGLNNTPVLPQRVVAKKLGISRSYISRLEKKAMSEIRKVINRKDFGY